MWPWKMKVLGLIIALGLFITSICFGVVNKVGASEEVWVETLRPNAEGSKTQLPNLYPNSGTHWEKVDDVSSDEDTTAVGSYWEGWVRDTYEIPDISGKNLINEVRVFVRCRTQVIPNRTSIIPIIRTYGVDYQQSEFTGTIEYAAYVSVWETNPFTGLDWTPEEVNELEIGLRLRRSHTDIKGTYATQVWAEIEKRGDNTQEPEWLLSDLQIHTTNSDGKLPVGEVIKIYEDNGYDVIAITDHDFLTETKSDKILIIPALEWTYSNKRFPHMEHLLMYFINEKPQNVADAYANGAFIAVSHPITWDIWSSPVPDEVMGYELYNQGSGERLGSPWLPDWFPVKQTGRVAGSDAHNLSRYGQINVWIYAERNLDSIEQALRNGDIFVGNKP